MMAEMAHNAILVVCCNDIYNLNSGTIQTAIIIPWHILPCCKANTAPIRSVIDDGVACEFILHKWAQTETKADANVILLDHQRVPVPKQMQFTAMPLSTGKKESSFPWWTPSWFCRLVLVVTCCVVGIVAFWHNSATTRSYGDLYILACCQQQWETIPESVSSN